MRHPPPNQEVARSRRARGLKFAGWLALALLLVAPLPIIYELGRPRADELTARMGGLARAVAGPEQTLPNGGRVRQFTLVSTTGVEASVRVLRPAGESDDLPVAVILGGHQTGQDAVELLGAPEGVAFVALDYPYHGPTSLGTPLRFARGLAAIRAALLDTPAALSLAREWAAQQPWADGSRTELVGVSFGVPFAAVAGALDAGFRRVWLVHGGADNERWIRHNLSPYVPQAWLRPVSAWAVHRLVHGPTFDSAGWVARITPRPVVIVGAKQDRRLRRDNLEALYAAAREPKELLWTEGGHVGPGRTDIIADLLERLLPRLSETADGPPGG